jgi:hypothetical protein
MSWKPIINRRLSHSSASHITHICILTTAYTTQSFFLSSHIIVHHASEPTEGGTDRTMIASEKADHYLSHPTNIDPTQRAVCDDGIRMMGDIRHSTWKGFVR